MRQLALITILALSSQLAFADASVHTEDVGHFWQAFDSVLKTTEEQKQVFFLQKYYLDKGGNGLKYAMSPSYMEKGEAYTAKHWLKYILENREKLQRIRPHTLENLERQKKILEQKFKYFKQLYPAFDGTDVYFVVGGGDFGEIVNGRSVIIGVEVMAKDSPDWGISMVLHEFVHTLQKPANDALLQHCIMEGTADFVAELVNQKNLTETYPSGYIDFGNKNEQAVWDEFKKYIGSNEVDGKYYDWIYGTKGRVVNEVQMKDLGYFMGYTFCRAFYKKAKDKRQALKEIIEWDLSTNENAKKFLLESGYVKSSDIEFIKNLKFAPVVEIKKEIRKARYGYRLTHDEVIFTYSLGKAEDETAIGKFTVAGTFNGWNASDDNYKLSPEKNRTFELHLPKAKFEKGKTYLFKFVTNGVNWMGVPETASNLDEETGNLILKVD